MELEGIPDDQVQGEREDSGSSGSGQGSSRSYSKAGSFSRSGTEVKSMEEFKSYPSGQSTRRREFLVLLMYVFVFCS